MWETLQDNTANYIWPWHQVSCFSMSACVCECSITHLWVPERGCFWRYPSLAEWQLLAAAPLASSVWNSNPPAALTLGPYLPKQPHSITVTEITRDYCCHSTWPLLFLNIHLYTKELMNSWIWLVRSSSTLSFTASFASKKKIFFFTADDPHNLILITNRLLFNKDVT